MKKVFIVANWKSNIVEPSSWIQQTQDRTQNSEKEIIVCPSFTSLPILKSCIFNHKSSILLGAQDISPFGEGAYTGEVNGKQIKEFADYVIIGHSERRKHFGETEAIVQKKIEQAVESGLTPIICVSEEDQIAKIKDQIQNLKLKTLETKTLIAYEPLFAIGSGNSDSAQNAENIAYQIKNGLGEVSVLYGGSVNAKNVHDFTQMEHIDGVLVGSASLDVEEFKDIIKNA